MSAADRPSAEESRPRVLIVGAGFGGLSAALHLADAPVEVTVIDRNNYHGFWPLLYQVATAGLGIDDIARPLRSVLGPHRNISVLLGTVTGIDLERRVVTVDGEPPCPYDYLILATGSVTNDFGLPGVREHAFPLKSLSDAMALRNHILRTFESVNADPAGGEPGALTFVLVGGGPTGVELAGALRELIGVSLSSDFPRLDLSQTRVVVLEAMDHLLNGFCERSQSTALATLRSRGVEVRLNAKLSSVEAERVVLQDGSAIPTRTAVWTAGVEANPVSSLLPGAKGKGGTIPVTKQLSLPDHPEVFVIGDLAESKDRHGRPLPQLAQPAIQGGRYVAKTIRRRMEGKTTRPFHYHNHGIMATIGRRAAVAELPGGLFFSGTIGWLAWLGVHLVFLIGFRNRAVVLLNWAWNYITYDRSTRVILDMPGSPAGAESVSAQPPPGSA